MTNEQIIKALECCSSDAFNDSKERCTGCKYDGADKNLFCFEVLEKDALDLINRQKAELSKKDTEIDILIRKKESLNDEIAEVKAELETLEYKYRYIDSQIPMFEAEAIKEFAERLKEEVAHIPAWGAVAEKKIDNLVKEMTERKE